MLRCIFPEFDHDSWKKACQNFPNKVPRFKNVEDCKEFMKEHSGKSSNPDEPHLVHSVTTLVSWKQVEKYLLPKIKHYYGTSAASNGTSGNNDAKTLRLFPDDMLKDNIFAQSRGENSAKPVYDYLRSRVDLPIHQQTSMVSTENTLRYLFFHMRCGILVMIRGGKLVVFAPFVNKDYRNNWKGALNIDAKNNDIHEYYAEKGTADRENYLSDVNQWWANGNIICNVHTDMGEIDSQWWGDQYLFQLMDMLSEMCRTRHVPDCDFFINKRDYPHLKYNASFKGPAEPYGFIFDKDDRNPDDDIPLDEAQRYPTYTPILSFYSSDRFADIPMPPSEDWDAATGSIFPPTLKDALTQPRDHFRKLVPIPWSEKVNTAFFRGGATGGGVTPETNQRLKVAQLSYDWEQAHASDTHADADAYVPYLDAKITGMNMRDKKITGAPMTHIRKDAFPFPMGKQNFVKQNLQGKYKYNLYIEGHCAACRYGFMMTQNSVILKVDSKCVADQMWYFPLLQPYVDHVPVKEDLSNLKEQIQWCRDNDDKCQDIAKNASALYEMFVNKDGILDYMQTVCVELSKRHVWLADWIEQAPAARTPPVMPDFDGHDRLCIGDMELCHGCKERQQRATVEAQAPLDGDGATNGTWSAGADGVSMTEEEAFIKKRQNRLQLNRERAKRKKEAKEAAFQAHKEKKVKQEGGVRFH